MRKKRETKPGIPPFLVNDMKDKSQMLKILQLLDKEGPLSSKKISEISGVNFGSVRCLTTILNQAGLVKHYKEMRGIYEITEEGRKRLGGEEARLRNS